MAEQGACRAEPIQHADPDRAAAASAAPLVSVILVNYNGGALVTDCVRSVLASTVPVQVIVSDNGSTDRSLVRLQAAVGTDPRVTTVAHGVNYGFARGNNLVLSQARGKYLLFLNSDTVVRPETLERMVRVMDQHPDAGMAGCLILNTDGSEQAGCRRNDPTPWRALVHVLRLHALFPRSRLFQSFVLTGRPLPAKPVAVDAISGAFMLVRRDALQQVGPLDEGYFMHCEDLDWCMRFRKAGWQILFVPDVAIMHHKGGSSVSRPLPVLWHKHKGMMRYYRKFFRDRYPRPLMWIVGLAVWARFALLVPLALVRTRRSLADEPAPAITTASAVPLQHLPLAVPSDYPLTGPVLVTGGTGYIGRHLVKALLDRGLEVHVLARDVSGVDSIWPGFRVRGIQADLARPESLASVCSGMETVFHLASYAHAEPDIDGDDVPLHRRVTIEGTRALLAAAVDAGVKRFVFFSSVKAMGEGADQCLDENCGLPPITAYGHTKLAAERLVAAAGKRHQMHVCVLRLPLVYGGSGSRGNLPRMIAAVRRHLFPPLPEVGNRRSVVHVEDAVLAALLAAENRRANGQTYIVTDGEVYSTRQIYEKICHALGRPIPGWSVPMGLLQAAARTGDRLERLNHRRLPINSDVLQKLTGSAWYSSRKISEELGYRPAHHLDSALPEMVMQEPR